MNKRKINQQQQRRIAAKQAQLVDSAALSGLVIAHYGQSLEVEAEDGTIVVCKKRQNLGPIVPGDRVKWQKDPSTDGGVVVGIETRKSLLTRPDARGNLHAVAANIDQMYIVVAPAPAPNQTTIDRYLLAANAQHIEPIIVLNKEDLLEEEQNQLELKELLAVYKSLGLKTMVISAKRLQHLSLLHTSMENRTSVFVGQSGVGKSSIIATLLPHANIKTGEIAANIKQGKHTTTTARLYHLPQLHAKIIDSPGIREFPLWQLDPASLAQGFVEFIPYLHACKFRNCLHYNEPDCAVTAAAKAGKIAAARLNSYQKILAEMQQEQR